MRCRQRRADAQLRRHQSDPCPPFTGIFRQIFLRLTIRVTTDYVR